MREESVIFLLLSFAVLKIGKNRIQGKILIFNILKIHKVRSVKSEIMTQQKNQVQSILFISKDTASVNLLFGKLDLHWQ